MARCLTIQNASTITTAVIRPGEMDESTGFFFHRVPADDTDGAIVFQDGGVHFLDAIATRLAEGRIQFVMRQFSPSHDIVEQPSIMDEDLGPSFNDGLQSLASKRQHADKKIQTNQSGRGD